MNKAEIISTINEQLFDKLSEIYDELGIGVSDELDADWTDMVLSALDELVETYQAAKDDENV